MGSLVAINRKPIIPNEVEPLNIPKRSRLYHLEPIAVRTPQVEGLVSYICRLAEAHCVSPGILLNKAILPAFRNNYSTGFERAYAIQVDGNDAFVSSIAKPVYRKNPNEYGLLAWQYLEGLKLLTLRLDLQSLVIPPNANIILGKTTGQELGRDLRAWCPECFHDWHSTQQPIHEPLLWSVAVVYVCPIHFKPLQFHCPHCRKAQRPFTARMHVARCSQCSGWLGTRTEETLEIELLIITQLQQYLEIAERVMQSINLV